MIITKWSNRCFRPPTCSWRIKGSRKATLKVEGLLALFQPSRNPPIQTAAHQLLARPQMTSSRSRRRNGTRALERWARARAPPADIPEAKARISSQQNCTVQRQHPQEYMLTSSNIMNDAGAGMAQWQWRPSLWPEPADTLGLVCHCQYTKKRLKIHGSGMFMHHHVETTWWHCPILQHLKAHVEIRVLTLPTWTWWVSLCHSQKPSREPKNKH